MLHIDGRRFELGPGDSFQFRAASYAWENPGNEPAEVIWIVSPPIY
ncbi:cupin domain-containing protein [Paracoccus sp. PXZ]